VPLGLDAIEYVIAPVPEYPVATSVVEYVVPLYGVVVVGTVMVWDVKPAVTVCGAEDAGP
jgi:hypothetical protein